MTSRERVLAALNHAQPDRVPIDLSGHRASGIAASAYIDLRRALRLPEKKIRIYDPIMQLAIVDDDVLDLFGIDTIELGRGFALDDHWWTDWKMPDGASCQVPLWAVPEQAPDGWVLRSASGRVLARMPRGFPYFDQVYWPFFESDDLDHIPEAMTESMWCAIACPPGPSASHSGDLAVGARALRQNTDRAIIALFGGNLFEIGTWLYRMDRFLWMMAEEPTHVHRFLDRLTDIHLRNIESFLQAVGPYIDVVFFSDDLGGQQNTLMSPRMYREFFKDRHGAIWQRTKKLAGVKVLLHSCGSIRRLIPDLIEAGVDAINPVQLSAKGMDAGALKDEFGGMVTFWGGGCDTQHVLPQGSPEEVRVHVREQIETMAPNGGFIFSSVHNIQANVPAANVAAMFQTAREFGFRTGGPSKNKGERTE